MIAVPMVDVAEWQGPAPAGLSEQKHRRILAAAGRLFLRHGYEATTVDAIAREAGVSKATIYAHAGSKQELFGHILEDRCAEFWGELAGKALEATSIDQSLRRIGRHFLGVILRREALDLFRTVIAEAPRNPELGRIFYEAGPRLLSSRVAALIEAAQQRGELTVENPQAAGLIFLGMMQSCYHLPRLLGLLPEPSPSEIEGAVERIVDIFLRGFRPR